MWASRLESIFMRRLLMVGVLGVMVMNGLFLSNYSSERAHCYWYAMFPMFGLACLTHELAAGGGYEIALWRILLRQALHWIGSIITVRILFMQHGRGPDADRCSCLDYHPAARGHLFFRGSSLRPQLLLG